MEERVTVALKDLKPNPHQKAAGMELVREEVEKIKQSAEKSRFWEGLTVRKHNGSYEIAYGHHRLQAALELFGPNYEISCQLLPAGFDDDAMLVAWMNENAKDEEPGRNIKRVAHARIWLREHQCRACQVFAHRGQKLSKRGRENEGRPHDCGSAESLSEHFGRHNWSRQKVDRLLLLSDPKKTSPKLRDAVANIGGHGHGARKGEIGQKAAVELAKLPIPLQEAVVPILQRREGVTTADVKAVVETTQAAMDIAEREQQKKAKKTGKKAPSKSTALAVSDSTRRAAVNAATQLTAPAKKAPKELPDINTVTRQLSERIEKFLYHDELLEQVAKFQDTLSPIRRHSLVKALEGLSKRALQYAEKF